jgi:hypothetical protein
MGSDWRHCEAERILDRLPRNDFAAAVDALRRLMALRELTPERMHTLRLLQDKPLSFDGRVLALGIKIELAPGPPAE